MKIIVNGMAVEYHDRGTGPALLFLHGWKDSLHSFDQYQDAFSGYRAIAIDLPGFGQSEPPPSDWSLDDYADFIRDFLSKIGAKEIRAIIGHSFGGRIAIKSLATQKIASRKLILIASGGVAKHRTPKNLLYGILAKLGKGLFFFLPRWKKSLRNKLYKKSGSDYMDAGKLRGVFLKIIHEDLQQDASNLSLPTLVLWGENDTETPVADGKIFHQKIIGSQLRVFPNAGHFVHQEKSEEVITAIKNFI